MIWQDAQVGLHLSTPMQAHQRQIPLLNTAGSRWARRDVPLRAAPALTSLASFGTVKCEAIPVGDKTAVSTALASAKGPARRRVEQLLDQGSSLYSPAPGMKAAMEELMQHNPTPSPGPATLALGQGTWEVFYAPHIAALSSTLGTRFQPIRYILQGDAIATNVFYSSSLAQEGWLSSSGKLFSGTDDAVQVAFDTFWVDLGSTALRPTLLPGGSSKTGMGGVVDSVVNALGRAAFLPQFAVFPVKYLDAEMAVFTFPPLRDSPIAVRKVG